MTRETDKAERILEAAGRVLAEEGYGGATVARVAEEAEVSRGLLHYYFESKEHIMAHVLRRNVGRSTTMLRDLAAASAGPAEFATNLTAALREIAATDPAVFTVLAEALSASRRSDLIRRELTELHGEFTDAFEAAFEDWAEQGLMPADASLRGLAVLLTALVDGLGLDLVAVGGLAREEAVWATLEGSVARVLTEPL
jgi:AcrR family transcriptional regulator